MRTGGGGRGRGEGGGGGQACENLLGILPYRHYHTPPPAFQTLFLMPIAAGMIVNRTPQSWSVSFMYGNVITFSWRIAHHMANTVGLGSIL